MSNNKAKERLHQFVKAHPKRYKNVMKNPARTSDLPPKEMAKRRKLKMQGKPYNRSVGKGSAGGDQMLALKQQMAALMAQNKKLAENQDEIKSRYSKKDRSKKVVKNDNAIKDMENGNDKQFDHVFTFKKLKHGKPVPYQIHIVMRPATFSDTNRINNLVTQWTNGMSRWYDNQSLYDDTACAAMNILGIEVPKGLKDPHKLHRVDVLDTIYAKYLDWADNFRGSFEV